LAASGLPTEGFSFVGFPPTRAKARKDWFERVKDVGGTVVFFEAPHRIRQTLAELQRTVGDCPVMIGRELTKVHEELVRGQISEVLQALSDDRGEFTVVISIGHTTDSSQPALPTGAELAAEIGHMTVIDGLTKRKAINVVARKHGLAPNKVYEAVEAAKKSGI
jgi:16S rRNA (cytidine1402-2'-O)-methyltransferase